MTSVVCAAHGVETRLRCAECDAPVCIRCQVRTDVGIKCQSCAAAPVRPKAGRRRAAALIMAAGIVLLGVGAIALIGPGRAPAGAPVVAAGHWRSVPDLGAVRGSTVAVQLHDGRVLVVGGGVGSLPVAAAELFDPARSAWTAAADLKQARRGHAAVTLGDGRVLVAGGVAGDKVLASSEIYDPAQNTWTSTGALSTARLAHTLTALADGRVLAAGGASFGAAGLVAEASAEVYDPRAGTWSPVGGGMLSPRYQGAAVLLPDRRVLISGGAVEASAAGRSLETTELFDPAVGAFVRAGAMRQPRQGHTATLLADGRVLVVGGSTPEGTTASAELLDPARGTWSATASLAQGRRLHAATLLADGRVLVSGGESARLGSRASLASAEIYDPPSGHWSAAAAMACPRSAHAQASLGGGTVLAAGGDAAFPGEPPRAQSCAEIFTP